MQFFLLRAFLVGLGVAGIAFLVRSQGCGSATAWPSTVVIEHSSSKHKGYVVAWASPVDGGSSVFVHRFQSKESPAESGEPVVLTLAKDTKPHLVLRERELAGPPEIAAGRDGFMVLALTHKGALKSVTTDNELAPRASVTLAQNVRSICAAPAAHALGYVAAWVQERGDGQGAELRLASLDQVGAVKDERVVGAVSGTGRCALGANSRRVGVVYSDGGLLRLVSDDSLEVALIESSSEKKPHAKPFRLIPTQDGWFLLIGRGPRNAEVIRLSDTGERIGSFEIDNVDPRTIDIGANHGSEWKGGVFASWLADGNVHLVVFDDAGEIVRQYATEVARDANGIRAAGSKRRCVATWTSHFGRTVNLLTARHCI